MTARRPPKLSTEERERRAKPSFVERLLSTEEPDVVLDTVCGERSDSPDVTDEDRAEFADRLRRLRGELREQEPMSKPLSDERLAEIRDLHVNGGHGLPPVTAVFVLIGALGELVAEVDRLRRLTSYGIQVSVDVSTDDDPYARLWGRTAGWNYSDDGPVLLVEMEQTADA